VVICLERGADDMHMVQLMPLPPIISFFVKVQKFLPVSLLLDYPVDDILEMCTCMCVSCD